MYSIATTIFKSSAGRTDAQVLNPPSVRSLVILKGFTANISVTFCLSFSVSSWQRCRAFEFYERDTFAHQSKLKFGGFVTFLWLIVMCHQCQPFSALFPWIESRVIDVKFAKTSVSLNVFFVLQCVKVIRGFVALLLLIVICHWSKLLW